MKRINTTLAMLTLAATSSAFAVGITEFAELDVDQNGVLSVQEASADSTLAQKFTELDTNQDGELSEAEYNNA
ncbi:calmodulin [Neptunicella sp. SCSIO 80796]|uniref:calmodulin n=1 Tax=Neptunicella plasticusilytica TaxID=3117012 RepID=UPI003A4D65D4